MVAATRFLAASALAALSNSHDYDTAWTSSFSDSSTIPVTLHSYNTSTSPKTVTTIATSTPQITAQRTLWIPVLDSYSDAYGNNVFASVISADPNATTLAFNSDHNLDHKFPTQTLTVGPSTWNLLQIDNDFSTSTRSRDYTFGRLEGHTAHLGAICAVSQSGAGAETTSGVVKNVVFTDVTKVAVTLTDGAEKLLEFTSTATATATSETPLTVLELMATSGAGTATKPEPGATGSYSALPPASTAFASECVADLGLLAFVALLVGIWLW